MAISSISFSAAHLPPALRRANAGGQRPAAFNAPNHGYRMDMRLGARNNSRALTAQLLQRLERLARPDIARPLHKPKPPQSPPQQAAPAPAPSPAPAPPAPPTTSNNNPSPPASAPSPSPPASSTPNVTGSSGSSAPATSNPPIVPGIGVLMNNRSNLTIGGVSLSGTQYGVLVDNGKLSQNVSISDLTLHNSSRYGMYLGQVRNWNIHNADLRLGSGASEHGVRIADGRNITLRNSNVDTRLGHKSSMWLLNVDNVMVRNTTFSGGAIRIGARPNDNLGSPSAANIVIRDSEINKVSGGDMEAFAIWPGSNRVHLANLDITLTTSQNWLSIDSRDTANITWENIRVNGQLITGYEGVNLGGMSQHEAQARGIGAVA